MLQDARGKRNALKLVLRIVSLAGIVLAVTAVVAFSRKGNTFAASMMIFAALAFAILFSLAWTDSIFTSLAGAKRYVEGVEGDERHEWYAFKGMRVRVFLDGRKRPWFPLKEIAFILGLEADEHTFRHYGSSDLAVPDSAGEKCLSEAGLRRLVRYSKHPDAGALGLWLDREVLRMLKNRKEAGKL